jgi:hypothetical protein
MTIENKRILDEIRKKRSQGRVEIRLLRDSRSGIPEREAVLQLRYARYSVKKPQILNKVKTVPEVIDLHIIHVKEEQAVKGKAPIEWFLATSEEVTSAEEAYEYVGYYIQRWKIERFHYVLKSGCAIEKLQERSIDKTMALILMYSIIAVLILNMTYAGRLTPELPCSLLLGEEEWKLLYCAANKVKKEPKKPYTIKKAAETLFPKITWDGWEGRNARPVTDIPESKQYG